MAIFSAIDNPTRAVGYSPSHSHAIAVVWLVVGLCSGGCTWNHTVQTLNDTTGALAISPRVQIESSNRWVLPVNTRLIVAGSAEPKTLALLARGLRSAFAQVAMADVPAGTKTADIDLGLLEGDALIYMDYAQKQPVRFWALGKRWRLPRPGLDFGRARLYLISLPYGHSVHSAQIVTRSALGRRVNDAQLEHAFERFAHQLRPALTFR